MKYTQEQYTAVQSLFDYFNRELFDNTLNEVIITFTRGKKYHGFFWANSWKSDSEAVCEISLNPTSLNRDPEKWISTLVHEQCHLWQHQHGKNKPRAGYHNKEFAFKMESIGLMPSATGEQGGKKTGQSMTHYIIEGGNFQLAYKRMPEHILLPLKGVIFSEQEKPKAKDKIKYTCPGCQANAWAKSGLWLNCGECEQQMSEEESKSLVYL